MAIKVAQVITQSEMGGAQKHVLLLSSLLREKGYEVTVFAAPGGEMIEELKKMNIGFMEVPDMVREINPIRDLKATLFLYKKFKEEKYDIVHCHSSKAGLIGRLAAKLAGIKKRIYTVHGFVFNEPMGRVKKWAYTVIEKFGGLLSSDIIAVSNRDYDIALKYKVIDSKRLRYIPNAIEEIDIKKLAPGDLTRKKLGLNTNEFVIGTVANFYETKGHVYLIEALKRLYDEGYKFKTIFAGIGPKYDDMINFSSGYNDIKFLGYRKDNFDVINAMDMFVLPSVKEGMPYVVLEAMMLSKPVLCTRVGALGDIIKDEVNGFIVNSQSSDELYNKLKLILEHKYDLTRIGHEGGKYVRENFSIEKFIEDVIEVYSR